MCRFLESIRIENGEPQLLALHQDRVNRSLNTWNAKSLDLSELAAVQDFPKTGLFKWRIVYDAMGVIRQELQAYHRARHTSFLIVDGSHLDYSFKYEDRSELEKLKRTGYEIIIHRNGRICDSSYSNLIFEKDAKWFTPRSFLLNGVMRRHLLSIDAISEADITLDNIHLFRSFQLINAMNRFGENTYSLLDIVNPKI